MFSYFCLYAGDFNCRHADWGCDNNSLDRDCLAGCESINCLALLYNAKNAVFTPASGTLAPILKKKSLKSFPGHNIDLRLLHNQGLLWQCQARLLVKKILQVQVESLHGFDE